MDAYVQRHCGRPSLAERQRRMGKRDRVPNHMGLHGAGAFVAGHPVFLYVAVLFPAILPDGKRGRYAGHEPAQAGRGKAEPPAPALLRPEQSR